MTSSRRAEDRQRSRIPVGQRLVRPSCRMAAGLAVLVTAAAGAPSPGHPVSRSSASSPPAAAFRGGLFNGVSSVSATSAWAVGLIAPGRTQYTLTASWNGTRWTRVPSPSPGGRDAVSELTGVSAVPAAGAWAVGAYGTGLDDRTLILRWTGGRWSQVPSPNPG